MNKSTKIWMQKKAEEDLQSLLELAQRAGIRPVEGTAWQEAVREIKPFLEDGDFRTVNKILQTNWDLASNNEYLQAEALNRKLGGKPLEFATANIEGEPLTNLSKAYFEAIENTYEDTRKWNEIKDKIQGQYGKDALFDESGRLRKLEELTPIMKGINEKIKQIQNYNLFQRIFNTLKGRNPSQELQNLKLQQSILDADYRKFIKETELFNPNSEIGYLMDKNRTFSMFDGEDYKGFHEPLPLSKLVNEGDYQLSNEHRSLLANLRNRDSSLTEQGTISPKRWMGTVINDTASFGTSQDVSLPKFTNLVSELPLFEKQKLSPQEADLVSRYTGTSHSHPTIPGERWYLKQLEQIKDGKRDYLVTEDNYDNETKYNQMVGDDELRFVRGNSAYTQPSGLEGKQKEEVSPRIGGFKGGDLGAFRDQQNSLNFKGYNKTLGHKIFHADSGTQSGTRIIQDPDTNKFKTRTIIFERRQPTNPMKSNPYQKPNTPTTSQAPKSNFKTFNTFVNSLGKHSNTMLFGLTKLSSYKHSV